MLLQKENLKLNYIYNLSYQLLSIIVPIITTPYISRVLQAEGIGAYSYTYSIATYFTMFGNLGLATYGQLQISKSRDNEFEISRLFWEINAARFISITCSLLVYILVVVNSIQYKSLFLLLSLNLITSSLDVFWFLQGLEQFKKIVVRNFIIKITSVVLIFLIVKEKGDLYKYVLIIQFSTLLGNVSIIPYLRKYLTKIKLKDLKINRHWGAAFSYFVPTIATSVYTVFDKSMIGWFTTSPLENGYFEQAYNIEQVAGAIVTSLGSVTMPRLAYMFKNAEKSSIDEIIKNTLGFILCISIPMTLGMMGIADNLIPWFLGDGYLKSVPLLQIFSIIILIIGLNNTIGKQCLMARGRQKQFNMGVIFGAIINLIVNICLIPPLKSAGAAIGSVVAEFVILVIFIYYSKDILNIRKLCRMSLKYWIAGFIMYIFVSLIGTQLHSAAGLIVQILIGVITYFGLLLILKDKLLCNFLSQVLNSRHLN